jgi:hypothetical protein
MLVLSAGVETCRLASIFSGAAIKSLSKVMLYLRKILAVRRPPLLGMTAPGNIHIQRSGWRRG